MADGNDTHRLVTRTWPDGTRRLAVLRRSAATDKLSDDEIVTSLEEWRDNHPQDRAAGDE